MLLATAGANLLGNLLVGKVVITSERRLRASQDF